MSWKHSLVCRDNPPMKRRLASQLLICILLLSVLVCPQIRKSRANDVIYVGLLDDAREEMANWKPGIAQKRFVRPAFEKTEAGWKEMNSSSLPQMTWTVAFDGKSLGTVETQASSEERYTSVQELLTAQSAIPQVGSPSQQFAGLLGDGSQTKIRRPLVVVSKPYFRDPDGWKRIKLPDDIAALIRTAFRHEYPHVDRCKDEEIAQRNWNFPDSALSFPAVYGSNRHSFLVEASLDAGNCGYISQPDEPESEPWFFVSSDSTVRRIGSFMTLLDAGDYDNDGMSEVVFFLSQGENTDGFVLYDGAFKKPVTLAWHYH